MAFNVNSNVLSISTQKNLLKSNSHLSKSIERISSAQRINRAADDAAGLAVSEALRAEIRSLNQAYRNANDAISMAQVAEGGLSQMGDITLRMRELAMQSANGTISDEQRSLINEEYSALKNELNRISTTTSFLDQKLLDGSMASGVEFQVGTKNTPEDRVSLSLQETNADTMGLNSAGAEDISTREKAAATLEVIDDQAIGQIAQQRGRIGSFQNRMEHTITNIQNKTENITAADSRVRDADYAYETSLFIKNQIMTNAGASTMAQANVIPQHALTLLG